MLSPFQHHPSHDSIPHDGIIFNHPLPSQRPSLSLRPSHPKPPPQQHQLSLTQRPPPKSSDSPMPPLSPIFHHRHQSHHPLLIHHPPSTHHPSSPKQPRQHYLPTLTRYSLPPTHAPQSHHPFLTRHSPPPHHSPQHQHPLPFICIIPIISPHLELSTYPSILILPISLLSSSILSHSRSL